MKYLLPIFLFLSVCTVPAAEKTFTAGFDNYSLDAEYSGRTVKPQGKALNVRFVPGHQGGAVHFTGKPAITYRLPHFNPREGCFEAWAKRPSANDKSRAYLATIFGNPTYRFLLRLENDNLSLFIGAAPKNAILAAPFAAPMDKEWIHVAFCWREIGDKKTEFFLYGDGQLLKKSVLPISLKEFPAEAQLIPGSYLNGDMPFNGFLDEITVSDRARYTEQLIPGVSVKLNPEQIQRQIAELEKKVRELPETESMTRNLQELRTAAAALAQEAEPIAAYHKLLEKLAQLRSETECGIWHKQNPADVFSALPVSAMEKFNGGWENVAAEPQSWKLTGAGNEYLNAQLLLIPTQKTGREALTLSAEPFTNAEGKAFAFPAEFFRVERLTAAYHHPTQYWADILSPLKKGKAIRIPAELQYQPVWWTIYIPAGTPGGIYRSQLTVSGGGKKIALPIQIRVWGFSLPTAPRFQTAFGFSAAMMSQYYQAPAGTPRFEKLKSAWLENMLRHKVSPKALIRPNMSAWNKGDRHFLAPRIIRSTDGKWRLDTTDYERQLDELLPLGLNTIMVGNRGWVFNKDIPMEKQTVRFYYYDESDGKEKVLVMKNLSPEMKQFTSWLLPEWYGFLKRKGVAALTYAYPVDEPVAAAFKQINPVCKWMNRQVPELPNMVTSVPPSAENHGVKIWCPLNSMATDGNLQKRLKAGDKLWIYVCCSPSAPNLNLFLHQSGTVNRAVFWHAYQVGAKGFLYYEHALSLWNKRDVRKDQRWAEMPGTEGDGFLTYPGPEGPLNSVRFEYVRMGIQDVEYFLLLRELSAKLPPENPLAEKSRKALKIGRELIQDSANYCGNWTSFEERRNLLGCLIEKILKERNQKWN